jgi:lipid-A-disaccharide synthase
MEKKAKLMIVAGESSGELYGSLIAHYLKNDFDLIGIGGKYMADAGVKLIGEVTHAFGAFEAISKIKKLKENMKKANEALQNVEGVILIDFPDFNLNLAQKAKKLRKKVLYYVSPQIWAWRKKRIKKIKKVVDFMAVVLPFEEEIYEKEKIPVEFVGHPMFEVMKQELGLYMKNESLSLDNKRHIRDKFGIKKETVITLIPGSRPSEIKRKIPLMLNLVEKFDKSKTHFIIPKAPNIDFSEQFLKQITTKENVTVLNEKSFIALAMSDVAVITSGTSTLQSAIVQTPMIVVYRLSPLSYLIGKTIIKGVKHIALPNVIADFMNLNHVRIPEFIQKLDADEIAEEINKMLYDEYYREKIITFIGNIKRYFTEKEASREVYKICKKLFC